jgi:hypothetical protein
MVVGVGMVDMAVGVAAGRLLRLVLWLEWMLPMRTTDLRAFITPRNMFIHRNHKLLPIALKMDCTIHRHRPVQVAGNEWHIKC